MGILDGIERFADSQKVRNPVGNVDVKGLVKNVAKVGVPAAVKTGGRLLGAKNAYDIANETLDNAGTDMGATFANPNLSMGHKIAAGLESAGNVGAGYVAAIPGMRALGVGNLVKGAAGFGANAATDGRIVTGLLDKMGIDSSLNSALKNNDEFYGENRMGKNPVASEPAAGPTIPNDELRAHPKRGFDAEPAGEGPALAQAAKAAVPATSDQARAHVNEAGDALRKAYVGTGNDSPLSQDQLNTIANDTTGMGGFAAMAALAPARQGLAQAKRDYAMSLDHENIAAKQGSVGLNAARLQRENQNENEAFFGKNSGFTGEEAQQFQDYIHMNHPDLLNADPIARAEAMPKLRQGFVDTMSARNNRVAGPDTMKTFVPDPSKTHQMDWNDASTSPLLGTDIQTPNLFMRDDPNDITYAEILANKVGRGIGLSKAKQMIESKDGVVMRRGDFSGNSKNIYGTSDQKQRTY